VPNIQRVDLVWQMPNGGPGLTSFFGINAAPVAAAAKTMFTALAARIPAGITISYQGSGPNYDVASGALTDFFTGDVAWTVTGSGTGAWAAGVGASCKWTTGGVHGGHRVFGRTYFIPLNGFSYATDGTLDTNTLTDLQNATQAFVTNAGASLSIWSKPKPARPGKKGTLPAIAGATFLVTGRNVADTVSTLRSRRT
jgi:hypothetical protein